MKLIWKHYLPTLKIDHRIKIVLRTEFTEFQNVCLKNVFMSAVIETQGHREIQIHEEHVYESYVYFTGVTFSLLLLPNHKAHELPSLACHLSMFRT
jgi:hypothetical protein